MLSYGKSYVDEKSFKNMQIQFSILMKKEAKYIDDCKEILNGMWDGKSELDNNRKFPVGTIQYLIGLQYSYLKDVDHMMEYFNPALENLAGTPYEEDIRRIMTNLHVG